MKITKNELEKLIKAIKDNSYSTGETIVLGEILEIKISNDGLDFDIYRYRSQEEIERLEETDENYSTDDDYITTVSI